jgi:hypothetical protein
LPILVVKDDVPIRIMSGGIHYRPGAPEREPTEDVKRRRDMGTKQISVRASAAVLGALGGAAVSFLFQLIRQIPCHDVVVTGPSCPSFSVSIVPLAFGAVVGSTASLYIHRAFSKKA